MKVVSSDIVFFLVSVNLILTARQRHFQPRENTRRAMEANREESLKCLNLAQYALRLEGDREKAKRLAIKSNQLFPSKLAQDLINLLLAAGANAQAASTSAATMQPPTKEPIVITVSQDIFQEFILQ